MRVVGRSGVVMDLPDPLARALLADGSVRRVGARQPATEQGPPPPPPIDDAAHVCDECGYTARSAAGLAVHKRSHAKVDG